MQPMEIIGHRSQVEYIEKISKSEKIPQTYLFSGIGGTGKRKVAGYFAFLLLCQSAEAAPCMECTACKQLAAETLPDFITLSPDEKGNIPVGDRDKKEPGSIRWLIDRLNQKPLFDKHFVIIDGIESVSEAGQNALLKTIEEPGKDTFIVLITSSRSMVLPTIASRSIEIKFNPLLPSDIDKIISKDNPMDDFRRPIAEISGGSLLFARFLLDADKRNTVFQIINEISLFRERAIPIKTSINDIQKNSHINILDLLINIYASVLRLKITGDFQKFNFFDSLSNVANTSNEEIRKIILILTDIRKKDSNNVNVNFALKSLLYSVK